MDLLRQKVRQNLTQILNEKYEDVFNADIKKELEDIPVDFRTFVESLDHMGFVPLGERQYAVADFMLSGEDIFENGNYMAALEWGKGSGKDMMAGLIILYVIYRLLCLKNPQAYFGLPDGEPLDCLNVAMSASQAQNVFFEKFKQRVLRWTWLKNKYDIRIAGIYVGQLKKEEERKGEVLVTRNGIIFPKGIRAFSGHSAEASLEGLNLIAWTLDEYSAFKDKTQTRNAFKVYNMLKSSSTSRFGNKWKGFALSYPRYKDDPIEQLYKISRNELHWYGDKAATWEVKPAHLFSGKFFDFRGYKIPKEYEDEFRLDPTEATSKYLCIPPDAEAAFIEYPEKVDKCIDLQREPVATFLDYTENGEVKKKILTMGKEFPSKLHVITLDLGLKNDACALSMFRKESREGVDYLIQELGIAWEPDKTQGLIVSLINVEEIIIQLKQNFDITGVFFDQWNSALLIQKLNKVGITSSEYKLNYQDYKDLKERLYLYTIRLLNIPEQIMEIKQLVNRGSERVDHLVDGSKDRVDTIVGAVKILASPRSAQYYPSTGGIRIGENLSSAGGTFIG